MNCYIKNIATQNSLKTDIKELIPDAGLRRRMSRVVKTAVAVAVECVGGIENISSLDAIITATGWGCLTDSERFLANFIREKEQFLNPTPFIQSTFNTVGGQIALLGKNHCYNVTYAHRSHSFENALLDAFWRILDGESENLLVGSFDEQTPSQHKIMERMGLFRHQSDGEGAVFAQLSANPQGGIAQISAVDFLQKSLTEKEIESGYCTNNQSVIIYNPYKEFGFFPTAPAFGLCQAAEAISHGAKQAIVYNDFFGTKPTLITLKCI